jgi:hypothetical protein
MLPKNSVPYKAYVLRLWSDGPDTSWRAALVCARTGTRHPFATVADLVAFLDSETQIAQLPALSIEDTKNGEESQMEVGMEDVG